MKRLFFGILIIAAIVVFCVSMFVSGLSNYLTWKNNGVTVDATVTEFKRDYLHHNSYNVYVSYEYEGKTYNGDIQLLYFEVENMQLGDEIEVCINSKRPTQILKDTTIQLILSIIVPFFILSMTFAVAWGFASGRMQFRRRR